MILQVMDLFRFIQVYIIQLGVGGVYFFIIAGLILKRSTKRLNKIFSMFYISVACGTIVNVIYAAINISSIAIVLNILTYFLFNFGLIFLLLFNLILLHSEKQITNSKQFVLVFVWLIVLMGLFIIGLNGSVQLDETTSWKPVWYLPFFLYGVIFIIPLIAIPTLYTSYKINLQFEDQELKKRWKYYVIGVLLFYFMDLGTTTANFLADETFRMIWGLLSLIALLSLYTMYYGVVKQIKAD